MKFTAKKSIWDHPISLGKSDSQVGIGIHGIGIHGIGIHGVGILAAFYSRTVSLYSRISLKKKLQDGGCNHQPLNISLNTLKPEVVPIL